MKKTIIALSAALALATASCGDDDDTIDLNDYQDWRKQNDEWVISQQARLNEDGTPYYEVYVPSWNPGIFVLMHFFNDRSETAGNLTPIYTSVIDVIYDGYTCEDELFDSSSEVNLYGRKGVQRFACNRTIQGWAAATENMHVGDTAEIIVPYQAAYGSSQNGAILPYSSLRFNMRLLDINKYEANPN